MIRTPKRAEILRLCLCLLAATGPASATAADRPADAIVREIEDIARRRNSPEAKAGEADRAVGLIADLSRLYPKDARLAELLPQRWEQIIRADNIDRVAAEVDAVLGSTQIPALKVEAAYWKAELALERPASDLAACRPAVEAFLKLAPKDDRAGMLLYLLAYNEPEAADRIAIEGRILKDHPTPQLVGMIEGDRRRRAQVGRPFELGFTDAIGGQAVSIEKLRGKVVVVDFWATWCGPCVAAMPAMRATHARYKDKGVEFIGVSLDRQTDLAKFRKFVAENAIPWPQLFEGKRFESDLARRWDVAAIPTVFVVDRDGKLASVEGAVGLAAILDRLLAAKPRASEGGR